MFHDKMMITEMLISTICIYMIKMAVFSTTCGEIKMPAVR